MQPLCSSSQKGPQSATLQVQFLAIPLEHERQAVVLPRTDTHKNCTPVFRKFNVTPVTSEKALASTRTAKPQPAKSAPRTTKDRSSLPARCPRLPEQPTRHQPLVARKEHSRWNRPRAPAKADDS